MTGIQSVKAGPNRLQPRRKVRVFLPALCRIMKPDNLTRHAIRVKPARSATGRRADRRADRMAGHSRTAPSSVPMVTGAKTVVRVRARAARAAVPSVTAAKAVAPARADRAAAPSAIAVKAVAPVRVRVDRAAVPLATAARAAAPARVARAAVPSATAARAAAPAQARVARAAVHMAIAARAVALVLADRIHGPREHGLLSVQAEPVADVSRSPVFLTRSRTRQRRTAATLLPGTLLKKKPNVNRVIRKRKLPRSRSWSRTSTAP